MTRAWTLAESRLIAERVMEWQVFEFNGRLWLTDPSQRPKWLWDCAVPNWPSDPAAAAMALAALQVEGVTAYQHWAAMTRTYCISLHHQHDSRYPVLRESRDWSEAVMLAVLAAVEG